MNSYKDLENEAVLISPRGEELVGSLGETETVIRLPLTESTCSCPAGTICKHIVMTVLAAKKQGITQKNGQTITKQENLLFDLTPESMKKMVPAKEWKAALERMQDEKPVKIEEGSLIAVYRRDGSYVKLAYPFELSACSVCHDEKICRHKMWALFSYWEEKGAYSKEQLTAAVDVTPGSVDPETSNTEIIEELLEDLLVLLHEILLVGCARLSPETPFGLERFAIRCHGAGLAELEGKLRAFSEQVKGFQERRARVTVHSLMRHLSGCYGLAVQTLGAYKKGRDLSPLFGVFRTEYQDIPDLCLVGVGMRQFVSDSGFQGQILYFLEENSGLFYTYTLARPTIYEKQNTRNFVPNAVPWGLPSHFRQRARGRILLHHGKANWERRLSSTSKAQADFLGANVCLEGRETCFLYDDFERLWVDYRERLEKFRSRAENRNGMELPETDRLFLVRPQKLSGMHYDETGQRLIFYLEDFVGRRLRAQLIYSKQEETAIRSLEKMERSLQYQEKDPPVFLGSLYVENGECGFYPIETIEL